MKKKILMLFLLTFFISSVFGAVTYSPFHLTFEKGKPNNLKFIGYECLDVSCSQVDYNNPIEAYKGDSFGACKSYFEKGDATNFEKCMTKYKINGDTLNLSDCSTISNGCSGDDYIYFKTPNSKFGYVVYLFTSGDTYLPKYYKINTQCNYDSCLYPNMVNVEFQKVPEARVEVGQLNIVNLEDQKKPIQINVPLSVEQSVCSAYSFVNQNIWKPNPPYGYSDYSVKTNLILNIFDNSSNKLLYTNTLTLNLKADTCAHLQKSFTWVPNNNLLNRYVKFQVISKVNDSQVVNGLTDSASAIKLVYPQDLSNSCWVNVRDFTLSNKPSEEINPRVTSIIQGENLYAIFDVMAYIGSDFTPISYNVKIYEDNNLIYQKIYKPTSYATTDIVNLSKYTSKIGEHTFKLVVSPATNTSCSVTSPEIQTQELYISSVPKVSLNLYVKGENNQNIKFNASLKLVKPTDDLVINNFVKTKNNNNDKVVFNNLYRGEYLLKVSSNGYKPYYDEIIINSGTYKYIVLTKNDVAPTVALPSSLKEYYKKTIAINLKNYIVDTDTPFDKLKINYKISNPDINVIYKNDYLYLSTNTPNNGTLSVTVTDQDGLSSSSSSKISFYNVEIPQLLLNVEPSDGEAPLTVKYMITGELNENYKDICEIDTGDGNTPIVDTCANLEENLPTYVYQNPGIYNLKLYVNNSFDKKLVAQKLVTVYERKNKAPVIEEFTSQSSNGNYIPTNITFYWKVKDPEGDSMTCELFYNEKFVKLNNCNEGKYTITNFDKKGLTNFILVVRDNNSNIVRKTLTMIFENEDHAPVINETNTTFNLIVGKRFMHKINAYDSDGDALIFTDNCNLFNIDPNTGLINFVPTKDEVGTHICTISVSDGIKTTSKIFTFIVKLEDHAPVINMSVTNFTIPVGTHFYYKVNAYDSDGDTITYSDTCNLFNISPFTGVIEFTPIKDEIGIHKCKIVVSDGILSNYTKVEFNIISNNSNTTNSTNLSMLPVAQIMNTNLTFYPKKPFFIYAYNSYDPNNYEIVKYVLIDVKNNKVYTNNDGIFMTEEDKLGYYPFVLYVINEKGYTSLPYIFVVNIVDNFNKVTTKLIMNDTLYKGDFSFNIYTNNETIKSRLIKISPKVKFDGITGSLTKGSLLTTRIVTTYKNGRIFKFNLNTNDFNVNIPVNKPIQFEVLLKDEFGTIKNLTKTVIFKNRVNPEVMTSVSGNPSDLLNTLSNSLNTLNTGFNNINFKVVNNNNTNKNLELSITSIRGNVYYHRYVELQPYGTRDLSVPIYFNSKGTYPLRITLYSNNNKYTKYVFVNVK